ncbi:enoyl-CoA delta isomerase 2-like isoform X2 [Ptychodera flava]|uniref:enoyl-CoA delta isomerase 2-like isoform X2 n=1 Tax=Ptychodera flava TaxID=63121 RepID=UPI00396A9D48
MSVVVTLWRVQVIRPVVTSSRRMGSIDADFQSAKEKLNTLKDDPGNEVKLKMYALFKQATVGKCNAAKPSAFDFVGKAKWNAWNGLGALSQDDAKKQYVDIVNELLGAEASETVETAADGDYKNIKYTVEGRLCTILLNRPQRKNAITLEMYDEIADALTAAGKDPNVVVAVITGAGDYYCSGNDLSNFMNIPMDKMKELAVHGGEVLERFVASFIDFPKPLIAAVNGPALGVSVSTLALCDVVYCSDKARFHTPFTELGQSPEGCSSILFPRIMGQGKANELLLFGKPITAAQACERGLVAEVFPDSQFQTEIQKKLKEYAGLPKNSLKLTKELVRGIDKEVLHKVNKAECELLVERWTSDECVQAVMDFFAKRSKL